MYSFSVFPAGGTWSFVIYAETWRDLVTQTGFESELAAQIAAEAAISAVFTQIKVSYHAEHWDFVVFDQFGIEIVRNTQPLLCEEAAREAAFRAVHYYVAELFPQST